MQNLKGLIGRYMTIVTAAIVFVIICVAFGVQMLDAQHEAHTAADGMIVQIDSVLKKDWENVSEEELSNIFTLLRVNEAVEYYAVDVDTGMVIGSTMQDIIGKNATDIGLKISKMKRDKNGFHEKINGQSAFFVFRKVGDNWIGRSVTNKFLYGSVLWNTLGLALCCILMGTVQVILVTKYLNACVVDGIHEVNEKLKSISDGKLTENVDVRKSQEFEELSQYINEMVRSLMVGNRRLSYVLSKSHMKMGTYEFNDFTKKVLVTEQIAPILELKEEEMNILLSDKNEFRTYINHVRRYVFDEEENIYYYRRYSEKYIRVEELYENAKTFGILIDVTDEIVKRKQIEKERDIDLLTGLYNRRGLEIQLEKLFMHPEKLGYGAIVMIDADGLKGINDKYGHEEGDCYIKKIGNIIKGFGVNEALASRQGGDEFVLLLYGYTNEEEVANTIGSLKYIQSNSMVHLSNGEDVPLQFSFGYTIFVNRVDYVEMMKEADERMYTNKRERKNQK